MKTKSTTPEPLSGDFVLIQFDQARLLIDQVFVADAHALEVQLAATEKGFVYEAPDASVAVVVPNRHLALLHQAPPERRFLLVLSDGAAQLGIACETVQVLPAQELACTEPPAVMRYDGSPVAGFVDVDGHFTVYCDGPRLLAALVAAMES